MKRFFYLLNFCSGKSFIWNWGQRFCTWLFEVLVFNEFWFLTIKYICLYFAKIHENFTDIVKQWFFLIKFRIPDPNKKSKIILKIRNNNKKKSKNSSLMDLIKLNPRRNYCKRIKRNIDNIKEPKTIFSNNNNINQKQ